MLPSTSWAEDEMDCRYPAGLGGPFEGLPGFPEQCIPGIKFEPLTVCVDQQIFPSDLFGDDAAEPYVPLCHGEEPCLEVLGHYNSASGTVFPFLADDDDNVYFWNGRWHLHALDKRGNLRWRYDFCLPQRHPMCRWYGEENNCDQSGEPKVSWGPPTFLDYDGKLFFFIGDELYVMSTEGELLLQHRVRIPNSITEEYDDVIVSIGAGPGLNSTYINAHPGADSPALQKDGTFWVGYSEVTRDLSKTASGLLHMTRDGQVIDVIGESDFGTEAALGAQGVLLDSEEALVMKATETINNEAGWSRQPGHLRLLRDGGVVHQAEVRGIQSNEFADERQHEHSDVSPVYDPVANRSYLLSTFHGAIYGMNHDDGELRRIVNFAGGDFYLSYQNRPVIDATGRLYLVNDKRWAGADLFAFDTEYLWNNPQDAELSLTDWTSSHPGVSWTARTPRENASAAQSWSTPVLAKGNRLYTGLGGFAAVDTITGDVLWELGIGITATAPILLSDGTIVASSGVTGRIYFIKDLTSDEVAPLEAGWPQAFHDNYHSNNASHPHRWDRSLPRPYATVHSLLAQRGDACWNMADDDWNLPECNDMQEPTREAGGCAGCSMQGGQSSLGLLVFLVLFGLWTRCRRPREAS